MSGLLIKQPCPLCGTPDAEIREAHFGSQGLRANYRQVLCPGACGRYQMQEAAYASLPLRADVAATLAVQVAAISAKDTSEQGDVDIEVIKDLMSRNG